MIPPGSTIGILGGGQLGRMLAMAAAQLGYRCHVYAPEKDSIAAEVYGDATKWRAIAEYNEMSDPLTLRPGQRIIIPEL